jgi:fucose 4-O-acetylase-like acetyltransferase
MVWWMILLPVIKRVPCALAISIAIALGVGLMPWAGYPLSIARTLVFLPFFVAGVLYGKQIWNFLTIRNQWRILALCAVVALALVLNHFAVRNAWFYGSYRFEQLGVDALSGVLIRGALIAAAAVAAMSVFVMTPKVKIFITKAGRNSLSVFLLHGLFVVTIGPSIGNFVKQVNPWVGAGLLLVVSAAVVVLLSANFLDAAIRNGAKWVRDFISYSAKKNYDAFKSNRS